MAVPKKKTSPSRRNMRRSHHALSPPAYAECPELRRAEAAAPSVRVLRPLRRPRSRGAGNRGNLVARAGSRARRLRRERQSPSRSTPWAATARRHRDARRRHRAAALPGTRFLLFGDETPDRTAAGQAAAARRGSDACTIPTRRCAATPSRRRRCAPGGSSSMRLRHRRGRRRATPTASCRPAIPAR